MGRLCYPTQAPGTYPGTPRQRGQKTVTVQGGYGALFAVQLQTFLSIMCVAVQWIFEAESYPGIVNMLTVHERLASIPV